MEPKEIHQPKEGDDGAAGRFRDLMKVAKELHRGIAT
jgi:hypothetical protein